jgi:hypothetical protein
MRWTGHVACMYEMRNAQKILVRDLLKVHLGDIGGRIILK